MRWGTGAVGYCRLLVWWGVGPEATRHPAVSVRSVVVWSSQRDFVLLSVQEAVSARGGFVFHLFSLSLASESELLCQVSHIINLIQFL